jgi:hypothetical protein
MQTLAKVTLGIGGVMLAIGILLTILGARGLSSVEDFSVEDETVWSGSSGVYVNEESGEWGLLIFVSDEVRCDEFDLTVSNDDGGQARYEADWCVEDGKLPSGYADDPEGWLHMGSVRDIEYGVSYEFTSNEEVSVVPERVVVEIIEDAIGGAVGAMGGGSCACCGFFILLLGLILALTMKDEIPTSYQIDEQGKVFLNQGEEGVGPVPISPESGGSGEEVAATTDEWYKQTEN